MNSRILRYALHSLLWCSLVCPRLSVNAAFPARFESGPSQVSLVELFSSEGCSSCPPAEKWLSSLRNRSTLWKRFVPVEYHVDYWNYLGWTDPLAQPAFSQRQQEYARLWGSPGAVYTPGLVLRGQEWRPWGATSELEMPRLETGNLVVTAHASGIYNARFEPRKTTDRKAKTWVLHGALLGNGITDPVTRGENRGRNLTHEFVALAVADAPMLVTGNQGGVIAELSLQVPSSAQPHPHSLSVAFWVTESGHAEPAQATGGDL